LLSQVVLLVLLKLGVSPVSVVYFLVLLVLPRILLLPVERLVLFLVLPQLVFFLPLVVHLVLI
jgi:hypothetical protein